MRLEEREEEEEREERQPRMEEREEREPRVEETTEEETKSGVLAPGVTRSPASEREERRRLRIWEGVSDLETLSLSYIGDCWIRPRLGLLGLALFRGGPLKLPASVNRFTEASIIRRPPPKIGYFWRRSSYIFSEAVVL
jgi:hypothetical protein